MPFVLTLVVLAFLGKRTMLAAPDELRKVFDNTPPPDPVPPAHPTAPRGRPEGSPCGSRRTQRPDRARRWLAVARRLQPRRLQRRTGSSSAATSSDSAPGKDAKAVGFIVVGPKDDFGYNQAAYQGSEAVEEFPDIKVLDAGEHPRGRHGRATMEGMIAQGAKIIFATSYGHLQAAKKVAAAHPDVVVVQQGGLHRRPGPGQHGHLLRHRLRAGVPGRHRGGRGDQDRQARLRLRLPDPADGGQHQRVQLGAQSVQPDAESHAVDTAAGATRRSRRPRRQPAQPGSRRGDPAPGLHQTIIEATEAAGAYTVGYHADASSLAPKGWLTGSEWNWGPLYTDIVKTAIEGKFTGSQYNANYRVSMQRQEPVRPVEVRAERHRRHQGPDRQRRQEARSGRLALHRPDHRAGRRRSRSRRARRRRRRPSSRWTSSSRV